jgi:hypothetical protein
VKHFSCRISRNGAALPVDIVVAVPVNKKSFQTRMCVKINDEIQFEILEKLE